MFTQAVDLGGGRAPVGESVVDGNGTSKAAANGDGGGGDQDNTDAR